MALVKTSMSLCLVTLSLVMLVSANGYGLSDVSGYGLSDYSSSSLYNTHQHQCQMEYVSDYELLRELELRRQTYSSFSSGGFSSSSSSSLDQLSLEELLISSGKLSGPRGFRGGPGPVRLPGGQGGFRRPGGAAGAGAFGSSGASGAIGTIQGERERGSFHHQGPSASSTQGAFKDISGHNRENIRTDSKGFGHETIKDVNIDQGFRDREGVFNQDKINAGSSSGEFDRQSGKATGAIGSAGAKGGAGVGAIGNL